MKILFITNVPSPYRVEFFNELGKHCELTVLFEKTSSKERDKSWTEYQFVNFEGIFLEGIEFKTDMSICYDVIKYIKKNQYDSIVCSDFMSPTGMIAIEYMRLHKIPYYLESDGGIPKSGRGIRKKLKTYFISGAKGYFCTSNIHKEYYLTYGATEKNIIMYPFSSIRDSQILVSAVTHEKKEELRKDLEIQEEKVVLAVGQFIHRKGFDLLLESAKTFDENTGFYFVGGIPTEEYLSVREKYSLSNVHFVGFKKNDVLKKYYMAADLFVLPTREDIWGLVINEAMAYGLPIITTDRCLAGLELIQDEKNGYIVENENVEELTSAIKDILNDEQKKNIMTVQNIMRAHLYTIETMVKRHLEIFEKDGRTT